MSRAREDAKLAELAQNGCADSFSQLVSRNQARLLCFLSFYCRDRHSLEDAAQEAFLQAYLHLDQFDLERSFVTWLFTIARRLLQKRKTLSLVEEVDLGRLTSRDENPHERLDAMESRTSLWRRLRELTDDDEFQMLWMVYSEEVSLLEVAESLGTSHSACKKRLSRLRQRLRRELQMDDAATYCENLTARRAG